MTIRDRGNYLLSLDEELLRGGVILSEWCSLIVRETDIAFIGNANLATIFIAVSVIETYLKSEYSENCEESLYLLIKQSQIENDLKIDLHKLRKYRNKWVHVRNPTDDQGVLEKLNDYESELVEMAFFAVRCLRRTIYENQLI